MAGYGRTHIDILLTSLQIWVSLINGGAEWLGWLWRKRRKDGGGKRENTGKGIIDGLIDVSVPEVCPVWPSFLYVEYALLEDRIKSFRHISFSPCNPLLFSIYCLYIHSKCSFKRVTLSLHAAHCLPVLDFLLKFVTMLFISLIQMLTSAFIPTSL